MDKKIEVFYVILVAAAIGILMKFLELTDGFPFLEALGFALFTLLLIGSDWIEAYTSYKDLPPVGAGILVVNYAYILALASLGVILYSIARWKLNLGYYTLNVALIDFLDIVWCAVYLTYIEATERSNKTRLISVIAGCSMILSLDLFLSFLILTGNLQGYRLVLFLMFSAWVLQAIVTYLFRRLIACHLE